MRNIEDSSKGIRHVLGEKLGTAVMRIIIERTTVPNHKCTHVDCRDTSPLAPLLIGGISAAIEYNTRGAVFFRLGNDPTDRVILFSDSNHPSFG